MRAQEGEIDRVAGDAPPHPTRGAPLREDADAVRDLAYAEAAQHGAVPFVVLDADELREASRRHDLSKAQADAEPAEPVREPLLAPRRAAVRLVSVILLVTREGRPPLERAVMFLQCHGWASFLLNGSWGREFHPRSGRELTQVTARRQTTSRGDDAATSADRKPLPGPPQRPQHASAAKLL